MELIDILKTTSNLAGQANPLRDGDYTQNGLLYCGECHTPKQHRLGQEIAGQPLLVNCLCACAYKRKKELEAIEQNEKKTRWIAKMREEGFTERRMMEWKFSSDDGKTPELMKTARSYFENFNRFKNEGKGLLLYGGVGSGKTFAAACICNALVDKMVPCLITNISRISNFSQSHYEDRQEYFDDLNRFDLLILDDLSAERRTEYQNEVVYNVIDSRNRAKLPLIVTTNLTADELKRPTDKFEQRIYSRLFEMCQPFDCGNVDRRKAILKSDFEVYKKLLLD
ncbi:MAG: AAA family ATPase [Bacillota bacterium]|nr:AAA family ATPase [Bacillota bacterium]